MDTGLGTPASFPLSRNYGTGEKMEPRRPSAKAGVKGHTLALPQRAGPASCRRHFPNAPPGRSVPRLQTSRQRAASWEGRAGGRIGLRGGGARRARPKAA